jgi:hypothetical protein
MSKTSLARAVALAALGASVTLPGIAQAEFIKDSKASLELRNFYFNRDFRQEGATQSKAEEWAQGFLLRYESGFTEGTVGVGVDALGLLGVKLDSSPDRSNTGLLKRDRETGRAQDEYGELGLTAKLRASKSAQGRHPAAQAAGGPVQRLAPAAADLQGRPVELHGDRRPDLRCRPTQAGEPA